MRTLIGIAVSLAKLFIEDGALAFAILAVVAAAELCAVAVPNAAPARGAILLLGCLGVLLLNVIRSRPR